MHEIQEPIVSDHALIRWLERRHGIDMDFFRRQILDEIGSRHMAGTKKTKIDGLVYHFADGVLTTVIRKGSLPPVSENVVPFEFPSERRLKIVG